MISYELGQVSIGEQAHEALGIRRPVGQMEADLFLDVAWRRIQWLGDMIAELEFSAGRARSVFQYGEANAMMHQIEKYQRTYERLGELYLSVEWSLFQDILPGMLSPDLTE